RENGSVGIRNELWVVPTVGCVNGIADRIIEKFKEEVNFEGIDGVEAFKHNYGCSYIMCMNPLTHIYIFSCISNR
ncbi:Altronate hydrolase, partial [human gut metagenome]